MADKVEYGKRIYLGDGAYADVKSEEIRLWTERFQGTHEIFLEPRMLTDLMEFCKSQGMFE